MKKILIGLLILFSSGLQAEEAKGLIVGLVPERIGGTTFEVSSGAVFPITGNRMILSEPMTKNLAAHWQRGSHKGALHNATVENDTWYHVFLICGSSGIDVLASKELAPTNLPAGYSRYRRIANLYVDKTGGIRQFKAIEMAGGGLQVMWEKAGIDVRLMGEVSPTIIRHALPVPKGFPVWARLNYGAFARDHIRVYASTPWSQLPSTQTSEVDVQGSSDSNEYVADAIEVLTDEKSEILIASKEKPASFYASVLGWRDARR